METSILNPKDIKSVGASSDAPRRWRADARVFVRDVCKVEPDPWQDEVLAAVSGITLDPLNPPQPRIAMKACKGPGKSFTLALIIWWWMMTRWHANTIALSITEGNLQTNLWPELARIQQRSKALQLAFTHTAEQITAKKYERTWFCKARSFPQSADGQAQANTIAGLHGRHPAIFCDEAGDFPDGVVVAAEAIFSSLTDKFDARLCLAGNPTQTAGPLYRVCTNEVAKKQWWVKSITSDPLDPSRTSRVDKEWAQSQIDLWGRTSDFVKVNILGEFPSQQTNQLIAPDVVLRACNRILERNEYDQDPLIFGIDVARFGDNESVLTKRQGKLVKPQRRWREMDLMTLADQIANEVLTDNPAAIFVDGGGVGGGLIDRLRQLGVNVIAVDSGSTPLEAHFQDRRTEMWWKMAKWMPGASIPADPELQRQLTVPLYDHKALGRQTKLVLESKKDMKKRGAPSPDRADSLALTFAAPVVTPQGYMQRMHERMMQDRMPARIIGGTEDSWDPFGGA